MRCPPKNDIAAEQSTPTQSPILGRSPRRTAEAPRPGADRGRDRGPHSRLALRNIRRNLIHNLNERGIHLRSLADPVDTTQTDAMNRMTMLLLAMSAERQRIHANERAALAPHQVSAPTGVSSSAEPRNPFGAGERH